MWLLIIILMILFVLYCYGTWNHATFKKLGIPGPKPLPLLGNSLHLIKYGYNGDTILYKKYGRVYGYFCGRTPALCISDPELIRLITMKHFSKFMNREPFIQQKFLNDAILSLKDAKWRTVRSIVSSAFSSVKLKKMDVAMDNVALNTVQAFTKFAESGQMFDIENEIGSLALNLTSETLFGLKYDEDPISGGVFMKRIRAFMEEFNYMKPVLLIAYYFSFVRPVFKWLDVGYFSKETVAFFGDEIRKLLYIRRSSQNEKQTDLMQILLNAHSEEETTKVADGDNVTDFGTTKKNTLTEDEIVANSIIFLLLGFENVTVTVGWTMHLLTLHEGVQEKLFNEIKATVSGNERLTFECISEMTYLDQVFNETLRLYPNALIIERNCNEDCLVGSIRIPKGMTVYLSIYATHHDEEFWPDPEKFDPDRFSPENKDRIRPYTFFPFGLGPRNCAGMRFATLATKICVVRILQSYKLKRCEKTEECPKLKHAGMCIPANGIWVKIEQRH